MAASDRDSRETESGFSQPDSSESSSAPFSAEAVEEARTGRGNDDHCYGSGARSRTEPQNRLHSENIVSSSKTAPHKLEPYEPTTPPDSATSAATTTEASPSTPVHTLPTTSACGGDPSASFSDDIAENNNSASGEASSDGGKIE